MTPLDPQKLGEFMGMVIARLDAIDKKQDNFDVKLDGWTQQCKVCSENINNRIRKVEDSQVRTHTIGAFIAFLISVFASVLGRLWK